MESNLPTQLVELINELFGIHPGEDGVLFTYKIQGIMPSLGILIAEHWKEMERYAKDKHGENIYATTDPVTGAVTEISRETD